jgi:hypothetical protein
MVFERGIYRISEVAMGGGWFRIAKWVGFAAKEFNKRLRVGKHEQRSCMEVI